MKERPALKQKSERRGRHSRRIPSPASLPAKRQLLSAARHLFARRGLTGTSIRDIAQEAEVNSSLISYHFESKEGLYRACIEEISQNIYEMTERMLTPASNETEFRLQLHMFLDGIFHLLLDDRDTGLILIREYDRVHSPAEDIFRASFLKTLNLIVEFFKHAQKQKIIDPSKDPLTLASLLFGSVTSQMRMDHLIDKTYGKSLLDKAEKRKTENHIVDLFTIPPKNKL